MDPECYVYRSRSEVIAFLLRIERCPQLVHDLCVSWGRFFVLVSDGTEPLERRGTSIGEVSIGGNRGYGKSILKIPEGTQREHER